MLSASLSRAVGGRIGLTESEIIEFLAAPYRKADEFLAGLERLRERPGICIAKSKASLQGDRKPGRQIERNAKEIPQPKIDQALINRLTGLFQAQSKPMRPIRMCRSCRDWTSASSAARVR